MIENSRYRGDPLPLRARNESLADVLERVLDKGVVIAGDIAINILDIELLTLKLRLLVASADTAREMGINWWEDDPFLTSRGRQLEKENKDLRERLDRLEALVASSRQAGHQSPAAPDILESRIHHVEG